MEGDIEIIIKLKGNIEKVDKLLHDIENFCDFEHIESEHYIKA